MKVTINKILIEGFKGYKEKVEYEFGTYTNISADNGKGKTSIGEAIVWCLLGTDLFGTENAGTRLINKDSKKCEVSLDITIDGEPFNITRRKKSNNNSLFLNDAKATQNDISNELCLGKELFLTIFNPYYFTGLTPKASKELLTGIMKPVSRQDIFKELGDYLVGILEKNDFRIPATFLEDKRAEVKEHEENIIFLEGKIDGYKKEDIPVARVFMNEDELIELEEKYENVLNEKADKNKMYDLIDRKRDITSKYNRSEIPGIKIIDLEPINELYTDLNIIKKSQPELIDLKDISKLVADKKYLLNRYKCIEAGIKKVSFVKCDNCGHDVELDKNSKEELLKTIEEIKVKGSSIAEKIREIEIENKEAELKNMKIIEEFEADKIQKIINIEKEIEKLNELNDKISMENMELREKYKADMKIELDSINQELEDEEQSIRAFDNERQSKLKILKGRIEELKIVKADIEAAMYYRDKVIRSNEEVDKNIVNDNKRIENSRNKIEELKMAIEACKQYNSIKLKKETQMIKKYLDKVELKFEKLTQLGEIKDDYKILYEGKEFIKLSNAEKIKAGLEIGNFIMNMKELYFPIFVDNAESITAIPKLDTQMIVAKVVEGKDVEVNNE
ncbi:MAG: hypothetical protein ACRDA4_08170 [Filifactoraceae bacterium]